MPAMHGADFQQRILGDERLEFRTGGKFDFVVPLP